MKVDKVFEFDDVDQMTVHEVRVRKERSGVVTTDEAHSAMYHGHHRRVHRHEKN